MSSKVCWVIQIDSADKLMEITGGIKLFSVVDPVPLCFCPEPTSYSTFILWLCSMRFIIFYFPTILESWLRLSLHLYSWQIKVGLSPEWNLKWFQTQHLYACLWQEVVWWIKLMRVTSKFKYSIGAFTFSYLISLPKLHLTEMEAVTFSQSGTCDYQPHDLLR